MHTFHKLIFNEHFLLGNIRDQVQNIRQDINKCKKRVQYFPHRFIKFILNISKHKYIYNIILLEFITVNVN